MSSKSVNITNYKDAIYDGTLPGTFNESRTTFTFPTVFSINTKGASLVWSVFIELHKDNIPIQIKDEFLLPQKQLDQGITGYLMTSSYQISKSGVQGTPRKGVKPTIVKTGKNLGKKNETNVLTQVLRDALSKYNSKLKKGTQKKQTSSFNMPPPMLVAKLDNSIKATIKDNDFENGITVQRKFNGVRAVSYYDTKSEKIVIYSRTGREYLGLKNIKSDLLPILSKSKYSSIYLDGELYIHGKSLRQISGQARKEEDNNNLQYIIYDCFNPNDLSIKSIDRQNIIDEIVEKIGESHVKRAENFKVKNRQDMFNLAARFVKEKYEGAIARKDNEVYEYGKNNYHSSNLVKIKQIFDAEFKVVGFAEGIKGKDVGALIWICEVDKEHIKILDDITFNVVPKDMTYKLRYHIFKHLHDDMGNGKTRFETDFKNKKITIEFPDRSTKTGKPNQAKALGFRSNDDSDSTYVDPVTKLMKETNFKK